MTCICTPRTSARSSAAWSPSTTSTSRSRSGSIVSLIGPNGAGKTTFFNMLTGVYKPTAGPDRLRRHRRHRQAAARDHELGIGRTFQNIRLFQHMTALENVLVGMHSRLKGGIVGSIFGTPGMRREEREARERGARAARASPACAAATTSSRANLPYGDQRRLEVARALATEPKLLLLDEPTAGHEPAGDGRLHRLRLASSASERGLTVLLIEHDMKVVMGISDRVTVLDYGEKIAEGVAAGDPEGRARDRGLPRQGGGGGDERRRRRTAARSSSSRTSTRTTARSTR